MEKVINMSDASMLRDHANMFNEVKDSYFYCKLTKGDTGSLDIEDKPLKLNGTLVIMVCEGSEFDIDINLETYHVKPNTFISAFPGTLVHIKDKLPADLTAYVLFFNIAFLQNININMSSISVPPMLQRPEPVKLLDPDECDLLSKYFELLGLNTRDNNGSQISKSIATSLIAAMFYQMVQFYYKRIADIPETEHKPAGRRNDYVREFMRLVHIHFIKERSVSFYADKLFISSKYLSLLVKESTGRSASRWIDDFVLMEAKNMLRFSGKNIQQVAYALNFSTQSSFGKYFKHLTGMSPTEFQKS
ncbi:MAG: helix-turn-helix domain-containing protein [Muribaculaceae bacterium]|nr:helix-turn-helix domain-containing protein [Muribaculaceae bacterium]